MSDKQFQKQGLVPAIPIVATNPFLLFITTYWKQIIFICVFLFIGYQYLRINHLQLEKQVLEGEIILLNERYAGLNAQFAQCQQNYDLLNNAILNLSKRTAELQTSVNELSPAISRIRANTNDIVADILGKPDPQTCEDSLEFLRDNITVPWRPQ